MTETDIGEEGAKLLSESLKVNTTLLNFNLWSLESRQMNEKGTHEGRTDCGIGPEGAKSLSEALKVNVNLWHLNIQSEYYAKAMI